MRLGVGEEKMGKRGEEDSEEMMWRRWGEIRADV